MYLFNKSIQSRMLKFEQGICLCIEHVLYMLRLAYGYCGYHNTKLVDKLTNYQRKYYRILENVFDSETIAFEICLFFGAVSKFTNIEIRSHIDCEAISSNNELLVIGCRNKSLLIFDIENWICIRTFQSHVPNCCSISSNNRFVASGSRSSRFQIWDIMKGKCILKG